MSLPDLQQAINNIDADLNAMTTSPKPSYDIDGKAVSWAEYFKILTEMRKEISIAINQLNPYLIRTQQRMI